MDQFTGFYHKSYTHNAEAQSRFHDVMRRARNFAESRDIEIRGQLDTFITLFDPQVLLAYDPADFSRGVVIPSNWFGVPFADNRYITEGTLEVWVNYPTRYLHTVFSMTGGE